MSQRDKNMSQRDKNMSQRDKNMSVLHMSEGTSKGCF